LIETGLFSSVDINVNPKIDDRSDIVIKVQNAKPRDVTIGASFGTTEKFGGQFLWSHYNVDGKGSRFTTATFFSKAIQSQKLKYVVYDPLHKKQKLNNQLYATGENVTSYSVKKIGGESILWHEIFDNTEIGVGTCSEFSKTNDKVNLDERSKFRAVGFPIGFNFDTTENYLDPQCGLRGAAMVVPYICRQHIVSFSSKCSFYTPLSKEKFDNNTVIACYGKFCSIFSSKTDAIPRDKLLFGGGANSVRGYGYQLLGNVNDEKKPTGGKSVFEIGVESRIKISQNIGLAVFVEGGDVYDGRFPKFNKKMLYGGGIGIRYYTLLGPIRIDIAFPFKRRKTSSNKKIDSLFNVYVSIGQAF
jgi:translocation and assembly module TamA